VGLAALLQKKRKATAKDAKSAKEDGKTESETAD